MFPPSLLRCAQEDLSAKHVDQARVQRLEKDKAELAAKLADTETRLIESEGTIASLTAQIKVRASEGRSGAETGAPLTRRGLSSFAVAAVFADHAGVDA